MNYYITVTTLFAAATLFAGNQVSESQQPYIEKYKQQTQKVAPEDALLNTDPEPDLSKGFTPLYNGRNLDGWISRGGNCTFEARGDSIVGICVPGSPSTYLSTERDDYMDFIFTAEVRWEVDGNSGIMFRAQSKPGKKFETVFGPQAEMEGFGSGRGWSGGIYGQSAGGWRYPLWLDAHEEARSALKKDAWNRITIQAIGNNVKTWVNGIPAANWEDDAFKEGFFSLQVHSGSQGTIHFREIKVKELTEADKGTNLFASGDFSGWTNLRGNPVSQSWSIENGVVHRFGGRAGDIITRQHYKDFELVFEWKISEAGNSGLKYRTRSNLGLEYQILDDLKHRDGKNPKHRAASLYALVGAPDSKPIRPVGEWNHSRIIADGNQIEHWLNGEKVVEIQYGSDTWWKRFKESKYSKHEGFGSWSGPILLQDHSDEVWFRNLFIREL